jgi:hypothetical protein
MINQYNGLASITQPNFVFSNLKITNAFLNLEDLRMVMSTVIAVIKNSLGHITILGFVLEGAC